MTADRNRAGRPVRRSLIGTAVLALLAPITLLAGGEVALADDTTSAPTASDRVEVAEGALSWGVRHSIRSYLENFGHTNGYVAAYDGASYLKGDPAAEFPVSGGWVDASADEASIAFDGRLRMHGFGADWLHFENVRLDIAEGTAEITVDMRESFGTRSSVDDVVLATFALDGDDPVRETDGVFTVESGEGVFPEEIGAEHLPRMDGEPTYGGDNAHTDPFVLAASEADDGGDGGSGGDDPGDGGTGGETPSPSPGPEDPPVEVPQSGAFGESTATNAYGATLTVSPAYSLADRDQRVTLEGTGFPTSGKQGTFGGLYVLFGWVDPAAGDDWGPGHGGATGQTFDYAMDPVEQGTYQSMVSYPGNTTVPGFPMMDSSGNFEMEFPLLASKFTGAGQNEIDCYRMQCGVILIGAHGAQSPEGEIFVPVYFTDTADGTGNETPVNPNATGPTANPNVLGGVGAGASGPAAQNGGLGVNGGLLAATADGQGRMVALSGLLLLSAGALGAALLFRRRRLAAAPHPDTADLRRDA